MTRPDNVTVIALDTQAVLDEITYHKEQMGGMYRGEPLESVTTEDINNALRGARVDDVFYAAFDAFRDRIIQNALEIAAERMASAGSATNSEQ